MTELFGIPVIESSFIPENQPKIQIRSDVPVSDKFRATMDKWLLDRFGTESVAYMVSGNYVMNPKTAVKLRIACRTWVNDV